MFTANTLYKNKQMSIKILVCVNKEQIHEGCITLFILIMLNDTNYDLIYI